VRSRDLHSRCGLPTRFSQSAMVQRAHALHRKPGEAASSAFECRYCAIADLPRSPVIIRKRTFGIDLWYVVPTRCCLDFFERSKTRLGSFVAMAPLWRRIPSPWMTISGASQILKAGTASRSNGQPRIPPGDCTTAEARTQCYPRSDAKFADAGGDR
jgi:hypothetical protein